MTAELTVRIEPYCEDLRRWRWRRINAVGLRQSISAQSFDSHEAAYRDAVRVAHEIEAARGGEWGLTRLIKVQPAPRVVLR